MIYWGFLVILLTVGLAFAVGWYANDGAARLDRPPDPERQPYTGPLLGELPRAGRLPYDLGQHSTHAHAAFSGAMDPSYEIIPWDLAGAAYVLGQQRADQDTVTREVDAIMAEIEANPERWKG